MTFTEIFNYRQDQLEVTVDDTFYPTLVIQIAGDVCLSDDKCKEIENLAKSSYWKTLRNDVKGRVYEKDPIKIY